MLKNWGVTNTVYLEANSYEEAIKLFWEQIAKAGIGSVINQDPLPRCFVSVVDEIERASTSVQRDRG